MREMVTLWWGSEGIRLYENGAIEWIKKEEMTSEDCVLLRGINGRHNPAKKVKTPKLSTKWSR